MNDGVDNELIAFQTATEERNEGLNPLNGAVLLHGFESNLREDREQNEVRAILGVLYEGALVPYGLRNNLSPAEKKRMEKTPWDKYRICFYPYTGYKSQHDPHIVQYVGRSAFIAPISALEGYRFRRQTSGDKEKEMAVYNPPDGVRFPIERGLIFISESLLLSMENDLYDLGAMSGSSSTEILRSRVYVVEDAVFKDNQVFWRVIQERVSPAKGVQIDLPPFDFSIEDLNPASADVLGRSELIEGLPISLDLVKRYSVACAVLQLQNSYLDRHLSNGDIETNSRSGEVLVGIIAEIQKSRFELGRSLRVLSLVDSDSLLARQIHDLFRTTESLLERGSSVLNSLYPNAPIVDVPINGFSGRQPEDFFYMDLISRRALSIGGAFVWKDKKGSVYVDAQYFEQN